MQRLCVARGLGDDLDDPTGANSIDQIWYTPELVMWTQIPETLNGGVREFRAENV